MELISSAAARERSFSAPRRDFNPRRTSAPDDALAMRSIVVVFIRMREANHERRALATWTTAALPQWTWFDREPARLVTSTGVAA